MTTLNRRFIYLFMLIVVSFPLLSKFTTEPVPLPAAESLYKLVDELQPQTGKIALLAFDFEPGTRAENAPQAEVVLEHLMRKQIPAVIFSLAPRSLPFLDEIPRRIALRLQKENPAQTEYYTYGRAWINVGYRPGSELHIQALAKAENLTEFWGKDTQGVSLQTYPAFRELRTLKDVLFVGEFTGLVDVFSYYIQFLQREGYVPQLGHGCTSITIPEAYIYLDSGQLKGALEGLSGAAWYSNLLSSAYPGRKPDAAILANTALGVAQGAILFLIVLGNMWEFFGRTARSKK